MSRVQLRHPGEPGQVTAEYVVGVLGAVTVATVLLGPDATIVARIHELLAQLVESSLTLTLADLFRWPS